MKRFLFVLLLPAAAAAALGATAPGWDDAARLLPAEALEQFADGLRHAPHDRELRTGHALALLQRQPRTAETIAEAERQLAALVGEAHDDEWAVLARYYLARIPHLHRLPRDLDRAAALRHYEALAADLPHHLLGQLAFLHAALLRLAGADTAAEKRALLTDLEPAGAALTHPAVRRSFHHKLGDAWLRLGDEPARALRHFRIVYENPPEIWQLRATFLVQLGETARAAGDYALARRALREFVDAFPRDRRNGEVRRALARLEATP